MALTMNGYDVTIKHITERMGGGPSQTTAAPTYSVDQVVTIRGQKMKITKVYPNGSFDAVVVK